MYTYLYIYIYIYTYIYTHIYTNTYTYMYVCVHKYIHIFVYTYVYIPSVHPGEPPQGGFIYVCPFANSGWLPQGPLQGLWSALCNFCSTLIFNFDNTEPCREGGLYVCIHTYIYVCIHIYT